MTAKSWMALGTVFLALLIYLLIGHSSSSSSSSSSTRAVRRTPSNEARLEERGKQRRVAAPRATQEELSQEQRPAAQDSLPASAQGASQATASAPGRNDNAEAVVREYVMADGTKMQDHRANPSKPNLDGYLVLPDSVSDVRPDTLVKVRTALRPAMRECIRLNAKNPDAGAKMQALLKVSIASEQLRVDDLRLTISGLENDDALRSCVSAVVLGHEQEVPGAIDVPMHRMVFPYKL